MTLKGMYDNIADHYQTANRFGSISRSHQLAIEQITKHIPHPRDHYKVLDLGVGNGLFLKKLNESMPNADLTGIDISSEMLKLARQHLDIKTIEGSATDADLYLPMHSQDLVLAHFINAYIPIHALFNQAKNLTRSNGYFSLITTTYESFPQAQAMLTEFITQDSLVSRMVGHYYKNMVRNTTVASGQDELLRVFKEHDFEVLEHQRLHIPVRLNDIDELSTFGIEGTWFLNSLSIRMLPKHFLLERLKRLFSRIFTFPYEDTHIIDVVLAKK
ncbi:MAG: methyltransferase domain-containing protein [Legionellaceae bacterium]|nr:methyltransferase domain-containing protein [Legionellaceae bacterium]